MKLKLSLAFIIIGAIVFAYSQGKNEPFAQAEDFPRDALVYAQFADLPKFIKLWNESKLKKDYLASDNFAQLENRHLAIKLAERYRDLNNAVAFSLNLDTLSSISETKAAIAVYDIGKLDVVFIAPVSEEIFNATRFFQNRELFEELKLENGSKFYTLETKVDRERQKQKVVFANYKGRFVLATNQQLLLRTLAIIGGESGKNSLADEPSFNILSKRISPNDATVWVDQAKLNDDYYFKQYWLMRNVEDLKKFRAGIFDFEMQDGKWTERREFLFAENQNSNALKIKDEEIENLRTMLPEDIPFYKVCSVKNEPALLADLTQNTLFEKFRQKEKRSERSWNREDYSYTDFYSSEADDRYDYSYRDSEYDEIIDNAEDAGIAEDSTEITTDFDADKIFDDEFQKVIRAANPRIVFSATSPKNLPAPLFADFRKVLIITLDSPQNLNRQALENALAKKLKSQLTIAGDSKNLNWENKENQRELNLPMLGWGIVYTLKDDKLILSNSAELLEEILSIKDTHNEKTIQEKLVFDDLTVIRLSEREQAFDQIMNKLAVGEKTDFFVGNVGSLLDVGSDVERVEIRRNSSAKYLSERIDLILNDKEKE
jgi:hypothetical protein